jgi:hypothetical protein
MNTAPHLKACPYCGCEAEKFSHSNDGLSFCHATDHWISCSGENCFATVGMCETEAEAIAAWNTRTDANHASLEILTEALKKIVKQNYGLQGIIEDYGSDTNKYNYHAMRYWAGCVDRNRATASDALKKIKELSHEG